MDLKWTSASPPTCTGWHWIRFKKDETRSWVLSLENLIEAHQEICLENRVAFANHYNPREYTRVAWLGPVLPPRLDSRAAQGINRLLEERGYEPLQPSVIQEAGVGQGIWENAIPRGKGWYWMACTRYGELYLEAHQMEALRKSWRMEIHRAMEDAYWWSGPIQPPVDPY